MNDLIQITYESDRPTVSGRELHEALEVKTEYKKWFERMTAYGFSEGTDFAKVTQKCLTSSTGQNITDHQLTIDMAKELCMIQRTDKGKECRQYFLEVERRWNSPEATMARALQFANRQLDAAQGKVKELEAKVEKDRPKVLFADAVSTAKSSILVGELAKLLKQNGVEIGQNRLFDWLRQNGFLIRRKGTDYNMPTQRAMEQGLFEIKETSIAHADGHTSISKTPKVTGKGQCYFVQRFLGEKLKS